MMRAPAIPTRPHPLAWLGPAVFAAVTIGQLALLTSVLIR